MKQHLINAGNTLFTTVATAIIGPIVGTIKSVDYAETGMEFPQNAIAYIKTLRIRKADWTADDVEVGKIVMPGMTGIGAMVWK